MQSFSYYYKHPRSFGLVILHRFGEWLPDRIYLQLLFRMEIGKRLNLKNPKSFSEKIQWLKLYNRKPEYTTMVDKYAVKNFVANIIGDHYIIPTLGVWDKPEDIDWAILPQKFVLKTTNGGGSKGVVICKDKNVFDKESAIVNLNVALKRDIYKRFREWPYKNVPKRIIAEQYLEDNNNHGLSDYKIYCFNGEPHIIMFSLGRMNGKPTFDYYDIEWNKLDLEWDKPNSGIIVPKPENLGEMLTVSRCLAKGIPHVRIDLYNINGKVYFGEITFFDSSGFNHFKPEDWGDKLGNLIKLPYNI